GGTSQEAAAAVLLKNGGLKPSDVEFIKMSYSDSNKALATKTIDAVVQVEPFVTMAEQEGIAKAVTGVYAVYPGQQSAGVFYSPSFIKDRHEAAVKFMRAYIRGCRAYNAAFSPGAKASEREEIVAILMKWTSLKDKELYSKMTPSGLDQDGRLNIASLKQDAEYYLNQGYIKSAPAWEAIVDNRFVEEAVRTLGAAKK
ncbi:MAG: ABC transporter substrate-binding protein, partial [Bdellovibrionaceae bacterium]|nr:ABC transporter substrate-binding protein [Pseudobdellovibrionaceae bacterium]